MSQRFTFHIVGGMILGMIVGFALCATIPDPKAAAVVAAYCSIVADIYFLRMIKMIIAPLVLSMLVVGIAHMGDPESIGRIGVKAMAWFVTASSSCCSARRAGLSIRHMLWIASAGGDRTFLRRVAQT